MTIPSTRISFQTIELMEELGYKNMAEGICAGLDGVLLQSFLEKDLNKINDILVYIDRNQGNGLAQQIIQLKADIQSFSEDNPGLAYQLNEEQKQLFSVVGLCDAIALYLYGSEAGTNIFDEYVDQDEKEKISLMLRDEPAYSFIRSDFVLGAYNESELESYFADIDKYLSEEEIDFGLVIGSYDHEVVLLYDAKNKSWIDPQVYPLKANENNQIALKGLVNYIYEQFSSENSHAVLTSAFYSSSENVAKFKVALDKLREDANFKKQHAISLDHLRRLDDLGNGILHLAASSRMLDVLSLVPKLIPSLMDIPNSLGETPLFLAAQRGSADAVRQLVNEGANINYGRLDDGLSPLMVASYLGRFDIAQVLLENQVNVTQASNNGRSAIYFATRFCHSKIVDMLADKCDLMQENSLHQSLAQVAILLKDIATLKVLVKHGVNLKTPTSIGEVPLKLAQQSDSELMREFAVEYEKQLQANTGFKLFDSDSTAKSESIEPTPPLTKKN